MFSAADDPVVVAAGQPAWVGFNVPWHKFGYDLGSEFDPAWFGRTFAGLAARGVNSVRFWVHADGRASPRFAADGTVLGPGSPRFLSDLRALAALARKNALILQLCLFSFDMPRL